MFEKNKIKFAQPFDFNSCSRILNSGHYVSQINSQWLSDYVLHSTFQIRGIQESPDLRDMYNYLQKNFNKNNSNSDLDIFYSMQSGIKSPTHRDDYDVFIIGALGRTLYKVEDKEFIVEPGDMLHIPARSLHVAIGLDPRIIFSYATY